MNNDLKHSEAFIRSKIGKHTGFSTPKNYFNGIEENLFVELSVKKLPKKKSFEIPSNYFEKLEDVILTKVSSETPKETKVISFSKRVLRFVPVAAAASVLLFIGINYFTLQNSTTTFDDITVADIESWYENGYQSIDNDELAMVLETTDFNENDFLNASSETDLENYLQTIDSSELVNETP